ncbi:hypothetical protein NKH52_29675 [Mesorhizobium sp. M1066]|uniref:hypothetical protein n=1 Tax=unclassified Mesorhizobium TaxID=325217 RepID=UPI00333795BC
MDRPELFERLENQLCGDYLRDNRSTRDIFVLVRNGEKAGWNVPGAANRVDFEGLICGTSEPLGTDCACVSGRR